MSTSTLSLVYAYLPALTNTSNLQVFQPMLCTYYVCPNLMLGGTLTSYQAVQYWDLFTNRVYEHQ